MNTENSNNNANTNEAQAQTTKQSENDQANDEAKQAETVKAEQSGAKQETSKADESSKDDKGNKDAESLTKAITKMRSRIDAEAGKKHEYKDQLDKAKAENETLTAKLKKLTGNSPDKSSEADKNPELTKANQQIKALQAQITRNNQMQTVSGQFSKAGVNVPADVLSLVVPMNADEKQVSANMKALSSFYDSIVAGVRKSYMSAPVPRTTGTATKPFDYHKVAQIKDPMKRLAAIKAHLANKNN